MSITLVIAAVLALFGTFMLA
ncbi:MAG: hypothetical protein JWR39_322, partial [Devosia sp.]|nr:hypothetical protein [Devosia sp.]